MKYLVSLVSVLFLVSACYAEPDTEEKADEEMTVNECPVIGIKGKFSDCLSCHITPTWEVKQSKPFAKYDAAKPYGCEIRDNNGRLEIYYELIEIDDKRVFEVIEYAKYTNIDKIVLEIHSPGGSLFDAQRIIGLLDNYKSWGGEVQTRVNGFAASAGFYIFMDGDERLVSPTAQLMWHELYTFSLFKISGPSDSEDEARVLRHLQNTVNQWIADRSHLTKEEIDTMVKKKELWVNGVQAVEKGFATGLIGG